MTPTADLLEMLGFFLGAMALGTWLIVLKLGLDDEGARRWKRLDGLLRIQSYANLTLYVVMLLLAVFGTLPFVYLMRVPAPVLDPADPTRGAAVLVIRVCLCLINGVVALLALVFVQVRMLLDRQQAVHGPHNRRVDDPPVPDPPAISPMHGPV